MKATCATPCVRYAPPLLEADVSYKVVKDFCDSVVEKAMGAEVIKSLHPGQMMVKIVNDELVQLMGPVDSNIYYVSPGPTVILLAGLQGSGKTTTAAKLSKYRPLPRQKALPSSPTTSNAPPPSNNSKPWANN